MNQSRLRRLAAEMIVIIILSIGAVLGGIYLSSSGKEFRKQINYREKFVSVIPCDSYELLKSPIIDNYDDITAVYIGYDSEGQPQGYIVDVNSTNEYGHQMHLLVGIDYESSAIAGLARINDSLVPAAMSDSQFAELKSSLIGKRIPVAFTGNVSEEETDTSPDIVINGLHDGIYYAQSIIKDSKGYIDFVEIEIESGRISHIRWDAFNLDPTTENRSEASLSGAYRISGLDWATQSYNVCHALIEVQNPALLNMKSDGTTAIIDGVTCDIRRFVELSEECIGYAESGYKKESYYQDMDTVLHQVLRSTAELHTNDDGFIVVSFDQNLSPFEVKTSDGVVVRYYTIRELARVFEAGNDDQDQTPDPHDQSQDIQYVSPTPVPDERTDYIDGAEDGYINTDVQSDSNLTDSVDDLPMSEIASFIDPVPGAGNASRLAVSCINTCYKFMKDYLNWLV